MTSWTKGSSYATSYTKSTLNPTRYEGREIALLGAVMDDTVYKMDDSVCTFDDTKLQSFVAPTTTWTKT
jgi:hypothetical protein